MFTTLLLTAWLGLGLASTPAALQPEHSNATEALTAEAFAVSFSADQEPMLRITTFGSCTVRCVSQPFTGIGSIYTVRVTTTRSECCDGPSNFCDAGDQGFGVAWNGRRCI